jgi:hypothetical protein
MSNGSELKSDGAKALRAAGFVPLPRWWVRPEDLSLIEYMARKHSEEVSAIRARVIREKAERQERERQMAKAWAANRRAGEE